MTGQLKLVTNAIKLTITGTASGNQNPTGNGTSDTTESEADSQLFFKFIIPKTKIYWGEKIPITFRLYVGEVRIEGPISSISFANRKLRLTISKNPANSKKLSMAKPMISLTSLVSYAL